MGKQVNTRLFGKAVKFFTCFTYYWPKQKRRNAT
jgi:hypothetical protein